MELGIESKMSRSANDRYLILSKNSILNILFFKFKISKHVKYLVVSVDDYILEYFYCLGFSILLNVFLICLL